MGPVTKNVLINIIVLLIVGSFGWLVMLFWSVVGGDRSPWENGASYYLKNDSKDTIYIRALELDVVFQDSINGPRYADTLRVNKIKYYIFPPGAITILTSSAKPHPRNYNFTRKDVDIDNNTLHVLYKGNSVTLNLKDTLKWTCLKSEKEIRCLRNIKDTELYK
jgi:hypothetical protein